MTRKQIDGRWGFGVWRVAELGCRAASAPVLIFVTAIALMALRFMTEPSTAAAMKAEGFFEAAWRGDVEALAHAVEHERMPVDLRQSGSGMTALMWAASTRQPAAVEWLLAHGADINASVDGRGTPLAIAVSSKDGADMAELLLNRGADPNACAADGLTPLMEAAFSNNAECVAMLLRAGARPESRARNGNTAGSIARSSGYDEIVRLLERENASDARRR